MRTWSAIVAMLHLTLWLSSVVRISVLPWNSCGAWVLVPLSTAGVTSVTLAMMFVDTFADIRTWVEKCIHRALNSRGVE